MENWSEFCKNYQKWDDSLFIGSVSFEIRSLNSIKVLIENSINLSNIEFELFRLTDNKGLHRNKLNALLEKNIREFNSLIDGSNLRYNLKNYNIYDEDKNLIGYENILNQFIKTHKNCHNYFLDISSFPRSVFFPLIKYLFEHKNTENLFILWTEKKGSLHETNVDSYSDNIKIPMFPEPPKAYNEPLFYLPVLGYDDAPIQKLFEDNYFDSFTYKQYYPILSFPSELPKDTDKIILRHFELFDEKITVVSDTLKFEGRLDLDNIIFIPYNNPFELYLKIKEFKENKLKIHKNPIITLSPFGTKAQSLGVCLSSLILNLPVLYYNPEFYKLTPLESSSHTEYDALVGNTYVALIKGVIYND